MDRTDEAINLFLKRYGKTPQEAGCPVIDIYERQNTFLYASSKEVIRAYKTQQNILRWVLKWFFWPLGGAMLVWILILFMYHTPFNILFIAVFAFQVIWMILFFVLFVKLKRTQKLLEFDQNIIYLNYSR